MLGETDMTCHPAPDRERASARLLAFGIFAPPLAWALRLFTSYALVSHSCSSPSMSASTASLLLIDLVAACVAATGGYVSFELWRVTRHESGGDAQHLMDVGEGRTRFLALCGVLSSGLFLVAIVFDAAALALGLPCR